MSDVETTVCMVTYRREPNLVEILRALRRQQPPLRIWLWNNGPDCLGVKMPSPDWLIESSRNVLCPPRWWLACQADTRYVLILDDDLLPATDTAVASLVGYCQPGRFVGPIGATLRGRYRDHREVRSQNVPQAVDVIKGRCVAGLASTIREAVLWSGVLFAKVYSDSEYADSEYDNLCIAEDIAISAAIAEQHYGRHIVPAGIADDWQNMREGPESLSRRADHMARRDKEAARWFHDS